METLSQVAKTVPRKATYPILSNVMVEAENDSVSFTTTDLERSTRIVVKNVIVESDGATTIPLSSLRKSISDISAKEVTIITDTETSVSIVSGCSGDSFELEGIPADEFPVMQMEDYGT